MGEKKTPGRFTISFNLADPTHRSVSDLLNEQGRKKAQFLVNAVQHYIHCPETPDIVAQATVVPAIDWDTLEALVLQILHKQGYPKEGETVSEREPPAFKNAAPQTPVQMGTAKEQLGASEMAIISDTILAFRKK